MKTANIAELKNHLSTYLSDVKRGEEILISDRNTPIAKIVPLQNINEFSAEEQAMAAAGILRLPENEDRYEIFRPKDRPNLKSGTVIKAIADERNED